MHVDAVEATAEALMSARRALMRGDYATARRALVLASQLIDNAQTGGRWDDTVSVFTLTATNLWNDLATAQSVEDLFPSEPEPAKKTHLVRGKPAPPEGWPYGTTHDLDCPACEGTSYTSSPRSETYWCS